MCESYYRQHDDNFFSLMPTNLYGPGDNFNLETSHVIPAMLKKIYEAKFNKNDTVIFWGSGKPKREFLYVDDLADAVELIITSIEAKDIYDLGISHLNVGSGKDISITELANMIQKIIGFKGKIKYDTSKPDGTQKKLLDISRINDLGWYPATSLKDGINKSYNWFLTNNL